MRKLVPTQDAKGLTANFDDPDAILRPANDYLAIAGVRTNSIIGHICCAGYVIPRPITTTTTIRGITGVAITAATTAAIIAAAAAATATTYARNGAACAASPQCPRCSIGSAVIPNSTGTAACLGAAAAIPCPNEISKSIWISTLAARIREAAAGPTTTTSYHNPVIKAISALPNIRRSTEGPVTAITPATPAAIRALAHRYLGAAEGDAFLASLGPEGPGETDILIHIRPERWLTMKQE